MNGLRGTIFNNTEPFQLRVSREWWENSDERSSHTLCRSRWVGGNSLCHRFPKLRQRLLKILGKHLIRAVPCLKRTYDKQELGRCHFMTLWLFVGCLCLSWTSEMPVSMVQLMGFMLSGLGQFLISAATALDMWSLQDRSFTVVTNVFTYSGLWYSCVGTSYGTTQCRPYYTILGLPGKRITVREEKKAFIEYFSTCWIKGNIFQRTLEGTLEYLAGFREDQPPTLLPLSVPPHSTSCMKMQSTAEKMVSLRNQMEIWWDIQSLAEQAQALRERHTM